MRAAVILIRHGDRSAIHPLPNATGPPAAWRCIPSAHEGAARREWPALRANFVVRRLADGSVLPRTLRPATLDADGASCEPGQLTPHGFGQHVRLGKHLAAAYAPLLDSLAATSAHGPPNASATRARPLLYVRSTDYQRTLLSAAGLLLGLFRQHAALRPRPSQPITLWTEDDETRDIMHGVGLSSSSKMKASAAAAASATSASAAGTGRTRDGGGETTREGICAAASQHARTQLGLWRPHSHTWAQLTELFGATSMATLKSTGIADALYARTCHGLPPPCGASGACVDARLSASVWRDADTFYCERFFGAKGGYSAARLSMLPLLVQILRRLEAAATDAEAAGADGADGGSAGGGGGGGPRLSLFSGHDTVIAPVLSAIGGMEAPGLCRWPPYASHLVFELWEPSAADAAVDRAARRRATMVRILFNGRPVTAWLDPWCNGREYCRLDNFAMAIRQLTRDFTRTCGIDVPS